MNIPMFSVVVITYNQEKTIKETLDSIINQSHEFAYEIIIGDDCSSDRTRTILGQYQQDYPDIVKPIYNKKNLGAMANYYNVLSKCQGKYIMDCAGDDYWLPGKVKQQIEYMESNPSVFMCYGKAQLFNETSNSLMDRFFGNGQCSFEQLLYENPVPSLTTCMRRDKLKQYLEEVDPQSHNWKMEDYPMWLWMSKNGTIHFIDSVFGVYRLASGSVSHNQDVEKLLSFQESSYEIKKYFADGNADYSDVVESSYHRAQAYCYAIANNKKEFQKHAIQSKDKLYIAMYFASFIPSVFSYIHKKATYF